MKSYSIFIFTKELTLRNEQRSKLLFWTKDTLLGAIYMYMWILKADMGLKCFTSNTILI